MGDSSFRADFFTFEGSARLVCDVFVTQRPVIKSIQSHTATRNEGAKPAASLVEVRRIAMREVIGPPIEV
jgi:hypothetical protein